MEVELHQLTLRYEHLRKRHPLQERTLLTSLAEIGQQVPMVVIAEAERFVLIDGYKRVRALKRLGRDTARATSWQVEEADALLLERGCAGEARMRWIRPGCWRSCKNALAGLWRNSRGVLNTAKVG